MNHILDNPIWHALNTGNKNLCVGTATAKYIQRDVGLFAGFEKYTADALTELTDLLSKGSQIILFTDGEIDIPATWTVKLNRPLLQMVYKQNSIGLATPSCIVPLEDKHIPAMLELTQLTKPGPFFSGTIRLGNYEGIFAESQLVAMIGQRLQPDNYIEISAVCTHPGHIGRGYGSQLLTSQINKIIAASRVPFLHAYPDNPAVKLYKKLGFEARKLLRVYLIEM